MPIQPTNKDVINEKEGEEKIGSLLAQIFQTANITL